MEITRPRFSEVKDFWRDRGLRQYVRENERRNDNYLASLREDPTLVEARFDDIDEHPIVLESGHSNYTRNMSPSMAVALFIEAEAVRYIDIDPELAERLLEYASDYGKGMQNVSAGLRAIDSLGNMEFKEMEVDAAASVFDKKMVAYLNARNAGRFNSLLLDPSGKSVPQFELNFLEEESRVVNSLYPRDQKISGATLSGARFAVSISGIVFPHATERYGPEANIIYPNFPQSRVM